jgi:hypothetical protein
MFGINKGCESALFLAFCDGMNGQSGLPGGLRAIDFHYTSPWETTDTDGEVQGDGS